MRVPPYGNRKCTFHTFTFWCATCAILTRSCRISSRKSIEVDTDPLQIGWIPTSLLKNWKFSNFSSYCVIWVRVKDAQVAKSKAHRNINFALLCTLVGSEVNPEGTWRSCAWPVHRCLQHYFLLLLTVLRTLFILLRLLLWSKHDYLNFS